MRTGSLFLLVLGLMLPLALSAGGCADPCEDLQEVCDDCTDETYRNACQRDVDDNVQSLCDNRVAFYRQQCPAPPPTTTGGGSNAGGSNAGGSGAGAMSAGGSNAGGSSAGGSSAGGSSAGGSSAGGSSAGGAGTGGASAGGAGGA